LKNTFFCVVARCYSGDQILKHELGGGSREREREKENSYRENMNETDLLEDLGVDGMIILK
jgi:hypothetical protein